MKKKKVTLKVEKQKPQNIAVLNLVNVKGGCHDKPFKAKRKKQKQDLKNKIRIDSDPYFFVTKFNINQSDSN